MIVTPRLRIEIRPKIPIAHFAELIALAYDLPRLDRDPTDTSLTGFLVEPLAQRFLSVLAGTLRGGLFKGYHPEFERDSAWRGRIDLVATLPQIYAGRSRIYTTRSLFDADTPLNRTLHAALRAVAAAMTIRNELRAQARRLATAFESVGDLRSGDHREPLDRRELTFAEARTLAAAIIDGGGATLVGGTASMSAFLFRTPAIFERAIRRLCGESLGVPVGQKSIAITGTAQPARPDLVFPGDVVGDVKYTLDAVAWSRAHVYQAVFFATAARSCDAIVISPRSAFVEPLRELGVGNVRVSHVGWPSDEELSWNVARASFAERLRAWWSAIGRTTTDKSV